MNKGLKLDSLKRCFEIARLGDITPAVYLEAAKVLKDNKRVDDAISILEESAENFPEDFLTLFILGKTLFHEGEIDMAAQILEKAIGLNPEDEKAIHLLKRAQSKPAEDTTVISQYHEGLAWRETYTRIANQLKKRGRESDSVRVLKEGGKNFPDDFIIHFKMGKSLYFLNRFSESVEALETAVTIKPEDKQAKSLLARAANAGRVTSQQQSSFKAPFLGRS